MKLVLSVIVGVLVIWPAACYSQESMELPFLPGETWLCSRGYNTATHRDYGYQWVDDRYALDFVLSGCSAYGKPILATHSSVIAEVGRNDSYGNYLLTEEDNGNRQRYGHNSRVIVGKGERVTQGQVISFCGNTGAVEGQVCTSHPGTHLHYAGYDENGDGLVPEPISSYTGMREGEYYTSRNTALLDQAYARYGSAMIGYPEYQMWDLETARRANSSHPWYYSWDPNNLYDARGMPQNCAIWHFDGGFFGDNAIVYDALGGARAAIVLHSGLWTFWTQRGGPRCPAKMPIRDESNVPSNLRSYYKENYKENGVTRLDGISAIQECTDGVMLWANGLPHFAWYPYCAPGYYENGWHPDASYLFTECYNRNGGSQNLGHAVPGGSGTARVHNWDGYDVQDFRRPDGTKAIIFYDPAGAVHNSCTAEAHCVYDRKILPYFESHGDVDRFGYPTTDQFEMDGKITQDFYEHRSGKHWRLATDGRTVDEIDLSRCVDKNKMAKAMSEECYRSPDNLIANGRFESCLDCWDTPIWPLEHGNINLSPPMAEFRINGDGDIWSVQLSQTLPPITSGQRLILTYDQRGVRTVHTVLGLTEQVNGQHVNCGLWQDYRHSPGTGWVEYRFPITVSRTTSGAKLTWAFGETGGSMFRIRNIRLVPDDSPPPPPPPPPVCTGEDDPGSFISNGGFTRNLDCWQFTKPAALDWLVPVVQPDHTLRVSVDHARQWYEITIFQDWVYTEAGKENELVFTGAANPPCTITAAIECANGSKPLWQDVNLSSGEQRFSLSYWPTLTSPDAKLVFYLGQDAGSVWLKAVSVKLKQSAPPPPPPPVCSGEDDPGSFISNGNFTRGLDCWQFDKPAGLDWLVPVVQPDNALRVSVDRARLWHELKLWQEWVYLTGGSELELIFTGAANPPCTITTAIECSNGTKPLWQDVNLNLASADHPISLPFWPAITDPAAKLIFYLGQDQGSVWLKDVSVRWKQPMQASVAKTLTVSPNPLNPSATLSFLLDQTKPVTVEIYDVSGRRVQTLFTGELPSGPQAIIWNGRDEQNQRVPSGIYFCQVRAGTELTRRRMIVVR